MTASSVSLSTAAAHYYVAWSRLDTLRTRLHPANWALNSFRQLLHISVMRIIRRRPVCPLQTSAMSQQKCAFGFLWWKLKETPYSRFKDQVFYMYLMTRRSPFHHLTSEKWRYVASGTTSPSGLGTILSALSRVSGTEKEKKEKMIHLGKVASIKARCCSVRTSFSTPVYAKLFRTWQWGTGWKMQYITSHSNTCQLLHPGIIEFVSRTQQKWGVWGFSLCECQILIVTCVIKRRYHGLHRAFYWLSKGLLQVKS